jgi:hypothetical protein
MMFRERMFATIIVLAGLLASSALAVDVVSPKGAERALTVSDFMPHANTTKEFNET